MPAALLEKHLIQNTQATFTPGTYFVEQYFYPKPKHTQTTVEESINGNLQDKNMVFEDNDETVMFAVE